MMSQKTKKKAPTAFGATAPPFLDYLRDILRRYPDGGQILKELIQNADDAKATEVVFIHDERSYRTESLWTDELGKYQGPALYTYNNAVFTDDDWERIQKAGRSGKINDPNKIGRFGIGFNSVYHITDVPSIFSSGHLGLMDPQENIFGERNGGFLWSLDDAEHQKALMTMQDQFQPIRDIVSLVGKQEWSKVVEADQYFKGTIFRFPLRNEKSEISDNLYDSDKVAELFDSFIADADLSLLFLKNVTSVSLIRISADGTVHKRLEVKSSDPSGVAVKSEHESVIEGLTRFRQINLDSDEHRETKWLITTCTMKKGKVQDLDVLSNKLSFFPRVDLAFPCGETRNGEGRLSCFLPLPNNESNKTGLPVHVNACFGLTDNRRHIKWQEEDQKHDEHALWNELLVKKVLPQAYLKMIQDAIKLSQQSSLPVSSVYSLWPDITQMQHKDKWSNVARDVFDQLFRQNVAVLSLAKNEQEFIPLSEAVLPCNGPTSPDIVSAIRRTLVSCGENLVTLSARVSRAIEASPHHSTSKHVTPTFLRGVLHRTGVHGIPKNDKLCLLEYILSDGKYKELEGLQLLPLSDGSFRSFTDREEDTALIDSKEFPRVLLPSCKHLFISQDLSPACRTHLKELARKNLFRVINVDKNHVAEYTRRYLPQDWKQTGTSLVTWDSRNSQHPPSDWFQTFWKFLNTHFSELSDFTDIPLIPVSPLSVSQPVSVAKLHQNTTLIFQSKSKRSLPDQIAQLVTKVGGTIVRGNEWIKHEDLDTYVLSPSPKNVMKVLKNLNSERLIRDLKSESHKAREELKAYFCQQSSLSDREKDLLLTLPLFQTMRGFCVAAQSKQAVLLTSDPTVPTDLPVPDSFIQCVTEADRRLLKLLSVNLLGPAETAVILTDCIERRMCSKEETEKIMTWILQHGNILFSQNQSLKDRCSNLSYIEVKGEMKKTSCFFDPRIQTFKVIFESDFFPPSVYTKTEQMLKSLTDLGLINKEADMSPAHFLHVATQIDKLHVDSHAEAFKKAQALLEILDTKELRSMFSHEQLMHLRKLKWIPGDQAGNKSEKSHFYCPDEMRHIMYEDIAGHVMPLAVKLGDRVSNKLGLKRLPPPEKVIENLSVLKSKAQEMVDPDTNVGFKKSLHSIYRHMQENISAFTAVMNKEMHWLWDHNQFVSPQDLVLDYPLGLDLSSYIGKVPNEFLLYKMMLQTFGLKTSLSNGEIVDILHSIQNNIQRRQQPYASPAEVKVSVEILSWLWRKKETVQDDIPVPVIVEDGRFTLKPRSEALLCDVSKTGLKDLQFSQENMYLLHEEIPIATAEWLKIQFLSNYILAPELVGIEECGQSEPITMRIKNILKEYDEESDIFNELIQNAEDAGADECKFMVDFRVHKEKPDSLIDPDMALCQGPCLWAFNNEQFSAEDWENIVRVGSASKENKVEKIGKFGLGFNAVYHVTDVPSILSGNRLLILDPNVTHLKKHIKHKSNPGIKLDLSQKRLFDCFPGQFAPYEHIFDCNFTRTNPSEPYTGTLIKLPFRREEEAQKSEISTKVYHKHDITALQQNFTRNAKTHLLFLKNIHTLSLQSIPDNGSTPPRDDEIQTILTVSKTVAGTMKIQDEILIKQHQAKKELMKLDGKCKEIIDSDMVNFVGITSQQSGKREQQYWLLYNCFGTNQCLKMSLQKNKKSAFSLPIGGIAVPLKKNSESLKLSPLQTDLVGRAFCFLPLPIHTGLPVNVNGAFAVTSNRKGLWESGEKHEWNKALLLDPLVTAYVTALLALKEMSENKQLENYSYHTFWPDREKVSDTFKPLVDAFYSAVAQQSNGPELLSDGEDWCSMNNAVFLHESIEKEKDISALAAEVCKKYANASNCVVPLPSWLRNGFKQAGLGKVLENRTWNWKKFYQEAVFKNLENMDPASRDTLILHAIDLNMEEIDSLLVSYPCIPTTGGQLQYINKLVHPSGRVACLFEPEEGRLLGGTENDFCSPRLKQRLVDLGMANDDLPLEDITKKAATVNEIWRVDEEKAYEHLKCLLELMRNHIDEADSPHWETLRMTAFLPAFSPGDIKMERNKTLQRPTAVFNDKFSLLVNMTHPVLDHTGIKIHNTDQLLEVLGVSSKLTINIVFQQLQEACKKSQSIDTSMLHKIANECYRCLDRWIITCEDTTLFSQWANSFPFILVGDTFVNISRVAENGQFEAKPYLHILPHAFSSFRNLWESVGVQKEFTTNQFLQVLQELHSKYGNQPLSESDRSTCLTILSKGIFEAKQKTTDECLIPNEHGVLQPAKELVYNDSPWMPVSPGITLCHGSIPRPMACHLGIKTTKHYSLEEYKDDFSPYAFEFEQREELAVRIKGIISAYPSKKDILKELIQNADDAEATEIHFVWDKRQHGKEKTFGKRWNRLQGPALCVFNNKVFSKDDIKGIQQLGEGGKQNTPGKIGKYGVGFNSVYHLTDCPSILTGDELLCISDPNQKYIDGHSGKPPSGIGYTLPDSFKEMHKDVYKSFLPDIFSLKEGTMFRLPLRTSANGKHSKISQQEVTDGDMRELCSALSEDPEGLLLFLKNICTIKIHQINDSGKLQTVFAVEKSFPEGSREVKDAFVQRLQRALNSEGLITPRTALYETTISTSDQRQSKWIIAEQFGSFKDNDVMKLSNKLPQGAIAARSGVKIPRSPQSSYPDFKGAVFCSLPLPGETGLPVHINGNFEVDAGRKNMWKEDGQSHKLNWNEFLKQNIIAPLYADLLCYIRDKTAVKTVPVIGVESCFDNYLFFWPTVCEKVVPEWQDMIHEVYRSMEEEGLDVIPVLRSPTRKIAKHEIKVFSFDWCNLSETETTKVPYLIHSAYDKINPILEDLGMKLVPTSVKMQKIWRSIKAAGIDVRQVSPAQVLNFLKEKPLNDPTQTDEDLPLPITATLIRDEQRCSQLLSFCLSDLNLNKDIKKNPRLLNGLPLLLTRDKYLRAFNSKSPKLISVHDSLFNGYEDKFADYKTIKDHIKLLQTCNFVEKCALSSAAGFLKPSVQSHLWKCDVDLDRGLYVPSEEMMTWLESLWRFILSEIKFEKYSDDDQCPTFDDVKKLFRDFCILPVVGPKNEHFLQTMKNLSSVIPHDSNKEIPEILIKLGFMRHDSNFFNKIDRQVYLFLHAELMDVHDKSSVLDQICNIDHSEFSHLSNEEMRTLQSFLQSGVSTCKNNSEYKRKLRSLPLFETMHGERVRIDGPATVFVLNSIYSATFPDLFTLRNINSIFLKCSLENQTLAGLLNITILSDMEYFMKFILPSIDTLTEKQTFQCLKMLLSLHQYFDFGQYKDKIVSTMKTVKLIRSSQGRLETASYYFDDSVELYRRMVPQEKFVPQTFWTELCGGDQHRTNRARKLIREFGMKHEVSKDDIIKFAYDIESEAKRNGELEELKQKSTLLLSAALTKVRNGKDIKLLESIANIKFIFPEKIRGDFCSFHQPFAEKRETVQIRGSLISRDVKHQKLIWTSMPIIHLPFITADVLKMLNSVGAHEQPPPHCVTSNMRNICQSPCKTEQLIKTRADVFRSSYAYLQSKGFDGQSLAGLPVVLVEEDTQLFKPENVCLSLQNDLDFRPYLYQILPQDAIYAEFFKKIGVQNAATAVQLCSVLADVHADSCDKPQMHANQLMTVKRAVEQLFKLIKAQGEQVFTSNVKTLYLPAVDGKLHPSCSLFYNDTVFETKRVEEALEDKFLLLEKLSNCHMENDVFEHHRLIKLLPHKFQPKMLSEITGEKMVEVQLCEYGTNCDFRGWFDRHLSSGAFRHGLISLLREQSQGQTTQEEAARMCEKTFGSIHIVCCKTLKTVLQLNEEPLHKTTRETDVCVQREQQGCTFYLKHYHDMAPKVIGKVNLTLTEEINALLGHQFPSAHLLVLGQLLMCDDLEDVLKTLADKGIRDSAETDCQVLSPPAPGTDIPGEWHDSLDMSFLNNFEEGEYVGYSTNDKYIYAVVVQELPGSSGRYSRRYKIEIGEDELVEVGHLDLYQFKREKKLKQEGKLYTTLMELVLLEGSEPHSSRPPRISLPASLDEAKKEIDKCLSEIWSLPEEERQKGIKRLYLRWHPDKNPDCPSLATEAFKYLKNRIDELTRGKKVSPSHSSQSSRYSNFQDFFHQWNQEARYHRSRREGFSRGYRSYNFWSYNTNVPRPNKEEAQRWFKQARCDLNAAQKDTDGGSTEWCLFKVHQAVEKALIAAEYKQNGQRRTSSSISAMAQKVSHYHPLLRNLPQIVEHLKTLGVDDKKTQYPNYHQFPHIPNGQFRSEKGALALSKASELLSKVEEYVN